MKLNLGERLMVNSPARLALQRWVLKNMRQMASLEPGGAVLEIGCGRGEGARMVTQAFRPGQIFLMDLDRKMAAMARQRGGVVLVGDAEALPLQDGGLKAVFGFGFLHHVPDWRLALSEVARVLEPGGIYFLEEYYPGAYLNPAARLVLRHPTHDRFHSPDLHQGLAKAGFELLGRRELSWLGIVAAARKR